MEETKIIENALQDPELNDFLQSIATQVQESVTLEVPQNYSIGGVDILVFLATYTLFRWAKDTLDHRRQLQQNQILEQQAKIVSSLIENGLPAKEAQAVVTTSLKNIEKLNADDPILKKALALLH